jgi:uncharacterized protein YoxC
MIVYYLGIFFIAITAVILTLFLIKTYESQHPEKEQQ